MCIRDRFRVNASERARITSTGRVGINETSPDRALHVTTTTDTEQIYVENTASSGRAQVRFVNPHGDWVTGLIGGTTDGDFITYTSAAKNFRVYTDNAERVRIDSLGNLLVGTTTEGSTNTQITVANGANAGITIRSGTSSWGCLYFSDATSGADEYRGAVQYNQTDDYMMFRTATAERMRITASGSFYVTTTSSHAAKHAIHSGSTVGCAEFASALGGAGAACQVNVRVNTSASQGLYIRQGGSSQTIAGGAHCARFWNSENARMQFGVNNTERFRIESNGDLKATDTSIGSLSDSRLKKNIADFTYDLTKFKQFKPRTFDWINPELHSDNTGIRGFVAQEIETVDSSLVGDYELFDETEDTKNPDLEIIKADDGTNKAKDAKLGSNDAMYISVIQQLITKIETLEAEVAALKSA